MDWSTFINFQGIDFKLIGGIIGVLLTIRKLDTKSFFGKKFFVWAVMILGFLAGALLASDKFEVSRMIYWGLIHGGVASILYQGGKTVIPGEESFFNGGKDVAKAKVGK